MAKGMGSYLYSGNQAVPKKQAPEEVKEEQKDETKDETVMPLTADNLQRLSSASTEQQVVKQNPYLQP